jgi:uncharacterized protein
LIVNGPRQSGKTSLLRLLHDDLGGSFSSLDEAAVLRVTRTDPGGFVREAARPTFVDEVQRGGDPLVLAIKAAVDRNDDRGQFVLAGSTRFLFEPRLSESLAGRALFVDLWPFSQGEIEGHREDAVATLFAGPDAIASSTCAGESRLDTFRRVCRGGMPEVVLADEDDRRELLGAYIRTLVSRDAPEVARVPGSVDLRSVVGAVAARTAQELNVTSLAQSIGVSGDVMARLLRMLETVYLIHRVPAWSRNLTAKSVRRPKVHVVDSGVAAVLCGVDAERLRRPEATISGALLETFVVGEIARQLTWSSVEAQLFHFRDRDGAEVDLVLERPSGEIVGIEVKAAHDVNAADLRGLRVLRDRTGDRFAAGVVLHCGEQIRWLEDRLLAVPVSFLWAASPQQDNAAVVARAR